METSKSVGLSVGTGIIATLISGLANTTPGLIGAVWYGWPVSWLYQLITFPIVWQVNYLNFVGDVVIWSVVLFVLLWIMKWACPMNKSAGK